MRVAATATSRAPRFGSSSASSSRSRSIAARGSHGAIPSRPKRPDSSNISGRSAVCVQVPFASTSTICGDLNATSTRWNARTLDSWRCRSSPDSSRPRRKSSDPEPWWASAARCGSSCDTRTEKASTSATSASWSKDPSTTGWPTSLGRSAGTPSRQCSTRSIVEPPGAGATTPCSCSWSPMGSGLARSGPDPRRHRLEARPTARARTEGGPYHGLPVGACRWRSDHRLPQERASRRARPTALLAARRSPRALDPRSGLLRRQQVPASRRHSRGPPGSHTLRHACVQRLVDAGFPLKTVGDYVGHRSPSSTMIYAEGAGRRIARSRARRREGSATRPPLPDPSSPIAPHIVAFVRHKRSLNRRYDVEDKALRLFDRYLVEAGVRTLSEINTSVLDAFFLSRPRNRPRSFNHLIGVVGRLFEWMVEHDIIDRSPVTMRPRRRGQARPPCILGLEHGQRLVDMAQLLPDRSKAPLRGPHLRDDIQLAVRPWPSRRRGGPFAVGRRRPQQEAF